MMPADDDMPRAEPRVGELLARGEPILDDESLADLLAWFGDPHAAEHPGHGDEEFAAQREIVRNASAAVDPQLLAHLERHPAALAAMRFLPSPPQLGSERVAPTWLEAELGASLAVATVERPYDLNELLHEQSPQALLRDLHRAEPPQPCPLQLEELVDVAQSQSREAIVQALLERPTVASFQRLQPLIDENYRQLRRILTAPWEGSLPQEPARKHF